MNGKALAGMGAEIVDLDGDGLPDIFFTAFSDQYNPIYRNLGKLLFEDGTVKAGLPSSVKTLGFGAKVFDFDNDGYPDIYVTNGHVIDNVKLYDPQLSYRQADLLYRNLGGGRFATSRRKAVRRSASSTWAAAWRWRISITTGTWM